MPRCFSPDTKKMFHSSWMFRLLNTSSFAMDNDGLCHFKWMQGKYFTSLWKRWRQSPHLILMIGSPPRVPKLNNDPVQGWDQMVVGICRVFICKRHFSQKSLDVSCPAVLKGACVFKGFSRIYPNQLERWNFEKLLKNCDQPREKAF